MMLKGRPRGWNAVTVGGSSNRLAKGVGSRLASPGTLATQMILLALVCAGLNLSSFLLGAEIGPSRGALVIVGGAMRDPQILARFFELAGGWDAPVVVIPTAAGEAEYGPNWGGLNSFRSLGAEHVTVLHTVDREVADTEDFVRPIREARGVFFTGGRQWRLADSYLDTLTQVALFELLDRGGVIGGSSAGATIQGSYLARGDTGGNTVMMGDHVRGMGFLKNSAIDQHLLRRNRQFDLIEIIQAHPELLGIGIDEDTAIVVQGDQFDVIGQGYVAIYDSQKIIPPSGFFYFLAPGDRFDLKQRLAQRSARTWQPLDLPQQLPWVRPPR